MELRSISSAVGRFILTVDSFTTFGEKDTANYYKGSAKAMSKGRATWRQHKFGETDLDSLLEACTHSCGVCVCAGDLPDGLVLHQTSNLCNSGQQQLRTCGVLLHPGSIREKTCRYAYLVMVRNQNIGRVKRFCQGKSVPCVIQVVNQVARRAEDTSGSMSVRKE
jgi:hypothetical protein